MISQDRPVMPAHVVEQFDGSSRSAQRILVAVQLVLAAGLGAVGAVAPDGDVSASVQLWVSIALAAVFVAASWMFSRMRLELEIDDRGFTARVRPFRRLRVDAQSVVHAELVDVQPFSEFGGWWERGLRSNRLLGGTGRTALLVTYLLDTGTREPKTCRLTLLSAYAQLLFDVLHLGDRAAGTNTDLRQ